MPGKRITKKQMAIYMDNRASGKTQSIAAAKAGISERSGRYIETGKRGLKSRIDRAWRTRKDPFAQVWEVDAVPMLQQGAYEASFILEQLQKKYPDQFPCSVLRTLQRKVKKWRALYGPDKEVMFEQKYEPGQLGVSDFTHPKKIKITIKGESLTHIFYHFRLPYSGLNYMQVFRGSGEPFTAFSQGLQEALCFIGGVPEVHRTDSLSASFKNLNSEAESDITERYKAFVEYYGMQAKHINPGKGHENGTIESSHRHIKNRIEQCLNIRGSNDFESFDDYRFFIQDVARKHNQHNAKKIEIELAALKPLPVDKAIEYTQTIAVVSSTSTIDVSRVTYTVPSRLIGERLHVRIYHDKLECYLGSHQAIVLERQHKPMRNKRSRVINYRHVIGSLVKKPGAFRSCKYRDDLLPDANYRSIWDHANRTMDTKTSCKFIVGLLHIAATQNCESELAEEVIKLIADAKPLRLAELQDRFNDRKITAPALLVLQHQLSDYNQLIPQFQDGLL